MNYFPQGQNYGPSFFLGNKPLWLNTLKIKSGAQPAMEGGMEIGQFAKGIDTFLLKSTQMYTKSSIEGLFCI